jgi:pyruvate formate lyase activating enzyme
MTVEQVIEIAVRDRVFYEKSGGGITLSGGEPLTQASFCKAVLTAAKSNGLHTAVETSGYVPWETIAPLVADVDLFLYDIKDTDAERHGQNTGGKLDLVLENLKRLDEAGARVVLRCPIVPGVNDNPEHEARLDDIFRSLRHGVAMGKVPYHNLGTAKWQALGREARVFQCAQDNIKAV